MTSRGPVNLFSFVFFACIFVVGCNKPSEDSHSSQVVEPGRSVLVFSKTEEFRHASIPAGIETIRLLGEKAGFEVSASEDAGLFTEDSLSEFAAVIFLNTTGDVLNVDQQIAFERYIQAGGGFVGIHSATDTEWKKTPGASYWPWFQRLVGGVFDGHPQDTDQVGDLTVRDRNHASTHMLPENWKVSDEWYDFKRVSSGINVLMTVDEGSYEGATMGKGEYHPVAWYRDFDGGRSFYTALGHTESSYENKNFQKLIKGGIEYAMGDSPTLNYANARPEPWRFTRTVLESGLSEPLKLAFSPAGDLYFVERRGGFRKYDFEKGESVLVHNFEDVNTRSEYGLLGLAFDPGFEDNRWVYIYRTIKKGRSGEHVLSRFKLVGSGLEEESEQVFLRIPADGEPDRETNHTGGDMQFDDRGNLWLSTGDDTKADEASYIDDRPGSIHRDAARTSGNTNDLRGKILRITPRDTPDENGRYYDIPEGNLFKNSKNAHPEIYVMGVRNPYTIAFDSRKKTLYWGDVGPDAREKSGRGPIGYDEINMAVEPGNYGWPYVIGDNIPYAYHDYEKDVSLGKVNVDAPENRSANNTGMKTLPPARAAWISYPYQVSEDYFELGSGGRSVVVGPVYYSDRVDPDSNINFPSYFDGKLIISDFIRSWIMAVNVGERDLPETIFPISNEKFNSPLDMAFGPDGALYIAEYGTGWFSENDDSHISRIEYYGGDNPRPVAIAKSSVTVGAEPLEITLDASESFDRNSSQEELTFKWSLLEDGKPVKLLGNQMVQVATIERSGVVDVELVVTDAGGESASDRVKLTIGNERPSVSIKTTGNRSFYWEETSPLAFEIVVSDHEDGSTVSGDISPGKVHIQKGYISGDQDLELVLAEKSVDPILKGREIVTEDSDCHACHEIEGDSIGPSYSEVASFYANNPNRFEIIETSIIEGVSGKWKGNHSMPAHPSLSEKEVSYIGEFIFSLDNRQLEDAAETSLLGLLHFDHHQNDYAETAVSRGGEMDLGTVSRGKYFINASYTDEGTDNAPSLKAVSTLVLRSPTIPAGEFDDIEGFMMVEISDGVKAAMVRGSNKSREFSYGLMRNIDLTDISTLQVDALAVKSMMAGGSLELRLDAPDSKPVAVAEVKPVPNPTGTEGVSLDVSDVTGVHDLYLGTSAFSEEDGKSLFIIMKLIFKQ